ncbi:MarR family winged helix-turn-helix transcriptional regulator [Microlunatus parietis]|uniref:DNA-binding MarR family transcriptional regulator n=1 Tax=Microlunatus parietis TaxID=682979 RepID=A0A7Y9LF34_9ACTN|nr:MarR family transcriptional regulator [Microlunatus parietis]NYE73681.1 DNA-binding MarR family transcriptional regulator [Microlunatus parietis]
MDTDEVARLRAVIGRLSRQLNASATHEGLTPSQASALGLIGGRGPLSLAELARLESLNPTMVSRIVGRLDELGLIRRRQNPDDLRAAWVEITPDGRAMTERIRDSRGQVVQACLDRLDHPDREAIAAALPALEHLVDELKKLSTAEP